MNIKKLLIINLIMFVSFNSNANYSPKQIAANVCCKLFGNENVSDQTKQLINQARDSFGISQTDRLPVKYITSKNSWLQHFLSFTWFGTWINKNYWENLSEQEKVFTAYHETAHHYLNHPLKQIGVTLSTLIASIALGRIFIPSVKNKLLACSLQTFLSAGLLNLIVPWYAKLCEKNADIKAAQKLCTLGKNDIVEHQIAQLSSELDQEVNNSSLLFPSIKDQVSYLQEIIQPHEENPYKS